ncbi:MAG: HEAT repeat domain-containing protein [Planctomycetes bacterium]|nr:HEAT repeat domain-containing protein [Planctomycetota bacterium]
MAHNLLKRWHKNWQTAFAASLVVIATVGCTAWPFQTKKNTTVITPGMRIATIREMAAQARDIDSTEQTRLTQQLATQIQTEPDPLVRQAIQETIAEYSTPLAQNVLLAGLQDDDLDVRLACCRQLAGRSELAVINALRQVIEKDDQLDARLAAVDALGNIPSPESVSALAIALKDRDPAMQYAGVQSLKAISGQDLGNDVKVWREYAEGEQPQISPQISVTERIKQYSPF